MAGWLVFFLLNIRLPMLSHALRSIESCPALRLKSALEMFDVVHQGAQSAVIDDFEGKGLRGAKIDIGEARQLPVMALVFLVTELDPFAEIYDGGCSWLSSA